MALQTASSANTKSLLNPPNYSDIFTSPVGVQIDAEITVQSGLGLFVATLHFERRYSDQLTELKQSDATYILLERVIKAIESKGYRVVSTKLNSIRLKLTLAWGGE